MNQFVVTLIVILLPGIVACVICDKIADHSKWTSFKFVVYAFVLGTMSYALLQVFYYIWDCITKYDTWTHLDTWNTAVSSAPSINALELILATVLAAPISFLVAFLINYKTFNRVARYLKVSFKYGDENLFSYYLNGKDIDWVYVRDISNDLTYFGKVASYSENKKIQEIVLSQVTVYTYEEAKFIYSTPNIYLTKNIGEFIIEGVEPDNNAAKPDNMKQSIPIERQLIRMKRQLSQVRRQIA